MGQWKNFEEIEENLCLAEINAILRAARKREQEQRKFQAALKGIDLGDDEPTQEDDLPTFEEVKRRAEAKLRGVSPDAAEWEEIGFTIIEE